MNEDQSEEIIDVSSLTRDEVLALLGPSCFIAPINAGPGTDAGSALNQMTTSESSQ